MARTLIAARIDSPLVKRLDALAGALADATERRHGLEGAERADDAT
jgi:hypothetical protein